MMRIVRHDAWAQPSLIVSAALSSLSSFFGAPEGLFSFVWNTPDDHVFEGKASAARWARELGPYGVANIVAMGALAIAFVIAFVVGLVRAWRARTNGVARLVLFVAAGALASIPFTPPWITSTVQVDTSVLPFLVLAAAFALGVEDGEAATSPQRPAILLGAFVALATLGIAFVLARPERPSDRRCSAETMTMRADPSTRLVVGDDPPASMAVLAANAYFLRRHDASFVEALEREVRPGRAMVLVYDACGSEGRLAIGDEAAIPRDRAWHTVTFVPTADPFVVAVGP
ncbi:MAG TPA: hypothetical protein VIF62_13255, partial [Labilithrix sp.]|jgi:hypothetical protein